MFVNGVKSAPSVVVLLGAAFCIQVHAGRPNNVLLFMPDDMQFLWNERPASPEAQLEQHTELVPHMNRIRTEGVVFTEAYVAGPKCAPSRFNILTGRYCSRGAHGRTRSAWTELFNSESRTTVNVPSCKLASGDMTDNLPTVLQANGYATILSGKWHLASDGTNYGSAYSAAISAVSSAGFSDPAAVYIDNMDTTSTTLTFSHNLEWTTAEAMSSIDTALAANKKFFLFYTPTCPHSPSIEDALTLFTSRATPSGTLTSDPISGMPSRQSIIDRAPSGRKSDSWIGTIYADDALGALLSHLETKSSLDETLVIVTMDHGQTAKETLYQGGARVALMARYPSMIQAGLTISQAVNNIDLAATILEAVSISASFGIDGVSWWSAATGESTASLSERDCIISEINYDRMALCGTLKYISAWSYDDVRRTRERRQGGGGGGGGGGNNMATSYPGASSLEQLYDLANDPTEQTNLVFSSVYSSSLATMRALISAHVSNTATASTASLTTAAPTTAAVAPITTMIHSSGKLTCSQLGWTSIVNSVCGESDDRLGGSSVSASLCNEASLADAISICDAAGARLCTVDEIDSGVTAGTGCGFDTSYTWTSTWCGLGPEGGKYYVGMGSGGVPSDRKCKNPKKLYPVRCCSDVDIAEITATPATTTTTFPFLSERKNCAALGWTVVGTACGESDKAFKNGEDKCFTWKNHPDAERKCLKLGGRSCSQADIEAGVGKATGCSFDSSFLWTSTPCSGGYIQAKGNGDGSTQCRIAKSKGPMRCCSDVTV